MKLLCVYPTTTLQGVTTQKTSTWNVIAVKASKKKGGGIKLTT